MSKEFIKEIKKGISEMCNKVGFNKNKQYLYYIKPYTENVAAILHFGFYTHQMSGHILVDVSIGVSYKNVEELYCKLCEIANSTYDFTIIRQIGYLMPERHYKDWDFVEGDDNTGVFEDLLRQIKTYGFDYVESMKDFNNLFKAFEMGTSILNVSRDRRLPILYYLKGEKEKGLKFIEEALERQQHGGVEEFDLDYPDFAEKYKAL